MSQPYIVLSTKKINSKHGGVIYQVNLVGAQDRCEYHTYVDRKNRNYKYWVRIIEHPSNGFVIKGCQIKRDDLISADSRISIVWQTDDANDVFSELYDIWREQDAEKANHA
jgi:hypothetical protein